MGACSILAPAALALLAGCQDTTTSSTFTCEVTLSGVEPDAALPGQDVVLTGSPFTSAMDTAVRVGGLAAAVTAVDRTGCDDCDTCRDDAGCVECTDCDTCGEPCLACVETTTFVVPELPPGPAAVVLYNGEGSSNALALEILAPDTGQ